MVLSGYKVTSARLANGETVAQNDHVYVSLPWSDRDGTPYNIARIIEFLPPHTTPKKGSRVAPSSEVMVRLSLYYRPADVSARSIADYRLLLATIHTDIQPLSNVRGRCHVRHKDRIDDLLKWKKLPDHFYFVKFFDPYIKREFEVIRTEMVNNVPPKVKEVLLSRYEYLVTEREMVSDLMEAFRSCCVCEQWASYQESVKCEACKKHYHMSCLNPPLVAKPAKGYSWVCPPCSFQRHQDVEQHKFLYTQTGLAPVKGKAGKAKEKISAADARPDVSFRGWPWRYFGGHSPEERKHEITIELKVSDYMDEVRAMDLAVPPWDVERLNLAMASYTNLGREKALKYMRRTKLADFKPIHFSDAETVTFEAELEHYGGLEAHEIAKLLKRTPAEVLRFSYIWKNQQLKKENEALRQHHKVNISHARQNKTLGAPSLGRMRAKARDDQDDDTTSLYNATFLKENPKVQCAACSTRISNVWWRCPRTVPGVAMCENCGANYRKYGVISFVKSEDSKKADKKETVTKKGAKGDTSGTSTPVPPPPPKLPPCAVCKKMEPKPMMARCKNCTFSVHAGCYGIPSQDMGPGWECDLCTNARLEENNLEPRCTLCPRDLTPVTAKIKRKPAANSEFDLLSVLKPTEGRRWAHILCSTWIPEVVYAEPSRLKTVEGVMTVSRDKWEDTCSLCNQRDGAVIGCTDCEALFHPACAWLSGYRMGFEFSLAKPGRHQIVAVTKFKDSEGVMGPGVWCKGHDLQERVIYDLHEVDPEQNETALQVYSSTYKAIPPHDSFPMLRKAQRLESYLPSSFSDEIIRPYTSGCTDCGVDVSPLWHDVDVDRGFKAISNEVKDEEGDHHEKMDVDGDGDGESSAGRGVDKNEHVVGGKRKVCHLCWFKYR
ncbi:hypothetical protein I316_00713 [Kwoniella heveanensis BCC8398]|uniref:ZNF1 n=1 Tax=Kwoniella heveanensis BCC8398 TaxID=1296120 RepID=A0A1B9H2V9_9TREE|nr:hypothetical protein I316_00713 [Kwoniella heveanensis BCC8398]